MFFLNSELQGLIFSFDPTYHELFKIVIKQINNYGSVIRNSRNKNITCLKNKHLIGNYVISGCESNQRIF
jgi:hypothetical protein